MTRRSLLTAALILLTACRPEATAVTTDAAPPVTVTGVSSSAESGAYAALEALDGRTPVPLLAMMADHQKENMRDHLLAVQEIVSGATRDDYAAVERAAGRIGFSDAMGQMCTHMGAGAPGFTEQALLFHHTADRIGVAARAKDRTRVLLELSATLETCTSCHAKWKQQVVDEPTFRRLTASQPPAMRHR